MKLRPIHLLFFGGITLILCAGKIESENPTAQEKSGDLAFQCTAPLEIIGEIPIPPPGSVVTVTTFANAISSAGQVVGYQFEEIDDGTTITQTFKAYVSDDSVTMDFFVDNDWSKATGIDENIVVGYILDDDYNPTSFYYDINSSGDPPSVVYLDDGTDTGYKALGVNTAYDGQTDSYEIHVVGQRQSNSIGDKAFKYTKYADDQSESTIFDSIPNTSIAASINDNDIIVGGYDIVFASFNFHAFLYNDDRTPAYIDLGDLSLYEPYESFALDINDQNVVVGYTKISDTYEHRAFWFDTNAPLHRAQMEVMDCITDTTGTLCPVEALSINNTDFIVGSGIYTPEPTSGDEAFLYDMHNDTLFNLNDLINDATWHLKEATDINNSGWIVGNGTRNGQGRAFKMHCSYDNATYLPVVLKNFWNAILRR